MLVRSTLLASALLVALAAPAAAQPVSPLYQSARDAGASASDAAGLAEAMQPAVQKAKLTAGDGAPGDFFGYSVSLSNDRALVSADSDDENGTESGSAYIFAGLGSVAAETGSEARVSLSAPVPNPATGRASLALTLDQPQHVRASVVDALGREVAVILDVEATGSVRLDVDTANLPPGVYVVRVAGTTFAEARPLTVIR